MPKSRESTDKERSGKERSSKDEKPNFKVVSDNRRARHEFEILEVVEAGIALSGTEVKSLRQGRANLADAFARVEEDQMWLYNCHISPYDHGNRFNHDPLRKRRLLMHKKQILKLRSRMQEKGLTLVPLKLFFRGNWAKVDLALARGKQLYDKRHSIAKRENQRQIERLVKRTR
jgi:SsrA-binding protein